MFRYLWKFHTVCVDFYIRNKKRRSIQQSNYWPRASFNVSHQNLQSLIHTELDKPNTKEPKPRKIRARTRSKTLRSLDTPLWNVETVTDSSWKVWGAQQWLHIKKWRSRFALKPCSAGTRSYVTAFLFANVFKKKDGERWIGGTRV